jgi:hypothetical protein
MDEAAKDGRSNSQKTPEEIRAERIAAVVDPRVRQELDGIANTRDTEIARVRERQQETFNSRVAELRDQKIRSANAPQLTPAGMRTPYLGDIGHARAENEAKAQVKTQNLDYLNKVAKDHNDQIDKRLDAQRENQAGRNPSDRHVAEPERDSADRSRGPNRYAELIKAQNYTERANQAEPEREKEQERTRQQQQQRQRGLDR